MMGDAVPTLPRSVCVLKYDDFTLLPMLLTQDPFGGVYDGAFLGAHVEEGRTYKLYARTPAVTSLGFRIMEQITVLTSVQVQAGDETVSTSVPEALN